MTATSGTYVYGGGPTTPSPTLPIGPPTDLFAGTYAEARALSGVKTGDRLQVLGRTSQSDGGQGLFTWIQGGTTTIDDGYELAAPGGIWQRFQTKIKASTFGLDQNGITASDIQLNLAIKCAIKAKKKLVLPNGLFMCAAPLLCYLGTFSTLNMSGQGGPALGAGRFNYTYPGSTTNPNTIIWANFNDRPALIYNAVRNGVLKNLCILGNNLNVAGSFSVPFPPSRNASDYVTNGCRDSRYSPYAGICFDPFNGPTPPDGGYLGMTYPQSSGSGSNGMLIENVGCYGFVVGVMNGPGGVPANGDQITCRDVVVGYCRISYASGQTQARNFNIEGGAVAHCHGHFDTFTYGTQNAPPPEVLNVLLGDSYYLINYGGGNGAASLKGCHAETFMCIGRGGVPTAVATPLLFDSCDLTPFNYLTWPVDTGPGCPPAQFYCGGPVKFSNCDFVGAGHTIEAWNFINNTAMVSPLFESCRFSGSIEPRRIPPIGEARAVSFATKVNCFVNGAATGGQSQVLSDNLYKINNSLALAWGNGINRINASFQTSRVADRFAEYNYVAPGAGVFGASTVGVAGITNTTLNATTVTFTKVNASQFFCENDLLCWQCLPKFGETTGSVIALKIPVGGIVGNNVTANMLWNPVEYDTVANQPNAGTVIDLYVNHWAPTDPLTCTTNGTVNLSNVTPLGTLLAGDFVMGAGPNAADIPNVVAGAVRVVSNDGAGNVVLSKTATGSHAGVGLRFGYLSPTTPVILTVATLPPGITGLRYMVSDALAPVYGSAVAGGGAVQAPVFWSASALAWIVG